MKKATLTLLVILLSLSLLGCGKEKFPKKPAEKPKTVAKQENKEGEELKPVAQEEYKYDARGRRDPFLSLIEITKKKPVKKKGASPFESYELEEIKLLAVAWNKKNKYYALILLPDKKTYTITEGTTLGLQGGRVERITSNSIVIREFIRDYRGEVKPRDVVLKLHKGEEE